MMMNCELYPRDIHKLALSVRWIFAAFVLWNATVKTSAAEFLVTGWGIEDVNYGRLQAPQGLNYVISVDGAFGGTTALLSNGTVSQWGAWAQSPPTNLNSVLEIDAGWAWVLVRLADGSIRCWGANDSGQISGIPSGNDYIQVAAGNMHGLALKSNGTVVGWGRNDYGQRNIPPGLTNVIAISAHGHNSLALKSDGTVIGWGNSGSGINNVPVGLMGVQKIACGDSFALALKADGSISAWGNNNYGQTNVPAGLNDVEKIFAEGNTAYAIRKNGTAVAWGYKSADYLKLPELPPGYVWHSIRGGWEHMYGLAQQLSAVDFMDQPQSQTVNQGQPVTFSVTATGSGTLSYQWRKDGLDIPGATSSSFSISSAQPWHIGDYAVKVTDSVGSVTSQEAALSLSGVDRELWRGLIGFWQFDGNLNDSGLLQKHMTGSQNTFVTSKEGVPNASVQLRGGAYLTLNPTPFNVNAAYSIGFWTYGLPEGVGKTQSLLSTGIDGSHGVNSTYVPSGSGGRFGFGTAWGQAIELTPFDSLYFNKWTYVTLIRRQASYELWVNGGMVGTAAIIKPSYDQGFLRLGRHSDAPYSYSPEAVVDSIRIYNRALSAEEVQALYVSENTIEFSTNPQSQTVTRGDSVTFSATATGVGSLTYQWQKDGLDIPGATSSSFSLAGAQPWHIGDYTVKVTDSVGSVMSQVATLGISGVDSGIWKGLVAYYPFEKGVKDLTLNKHDSENYGASAAQSRFGINDGAYYFDGSDYIQTNIDSNNLPLTISVWFAADPSTSRGSLVDSDDRGQYGNSLIIGYQTTKSLDVQYHDGYKSSDWKLSDDQWHHAVAVIENDTIKIFVDGDMINEWPYSLGNINGAPFRFGRHNTSMPLFFSGCMDDIRIYKRALSAAEVQALYDFESAGTNITQQPQSQTSRVGGSATLSVQATAFGTLSYQWRKEGVELPLATNATLELTDLTLADAGSYDVVVSSGSDSVTSDPAVLTVLHAPTLSAFSSQQVNEDATLGPLSFTIGDLDTPIEQLAVTASSSATGLVPNAAIQLAGVGTTRTLTLSPVAQASGTATITLTVSDGVLETTQSFSLTVQAVPDAPTDVTLTPSALAENNAPNAVVGTLASADVDSGDTHTYSLVSGSGSADNGSFTISGSSLRLGLSADHELKSSYSVRVRARDSAGLIVEKALTVTILNVNEAPTLAGPVTLAMIEDAEETLTYTVADVDTALSSLTLAATSSSNPALLPVSRVTASGTGSSRSVILDPIEGQSGTATITLTVSDGALNATTTLTVTVHEKDIVIAQQPQPQEVSELSEARFQVTLSSGGEFATYQWHRNNQPVNGATSSELVLPTALLSQAGNYHVVITNPKTSATSGQAVLLVRVLPEIKQQPEAVMVNVGDSAGFAVSALGRPVLTYQWRRNGADVAGARASSLDIAAVTLAHAGRYQVRIKNPANTTGILSREVEMGVVEAAGTSRTTKLQQSKTLKLTVAAAGNGLSYRWHRNGIAVSNTGRNRGWATRELTMENLLEADEGDYQCQVTGPGGTAWGAVTTVVVFSQKPKIQRPLLLDDAMVGKAYEFTVPLDLDQGGEATTYSATGLPPGLKIDASTGVISGKPTAAKAEGYFVKITASNSVGKDEETAGMAVAPLLPGTAGTYAAIVRPMGWQQGQVPYLPELYGRLDLTVASTGAYSGSLTLGAAKFPVKGVLDADAEVDPTGQLVIARTGKPNIEASFTLIPSEGKPRQLTGQVVGVNELHDLELLGWRQPWNSTVKATAYDGLYNLADTSWLGGEGMTQDMNGNPVPASAGYVSFTVGLNGGFSLAGRTGDGERVTSSGFVSGPPFERSVLYAYISATKGCLAGDLEFEPESAEGARDGRAWARLLSWNRAPGGSASRLYKAGFSDVIVSLAGGHYVPPAKVEPFLDSIALPASPNNAHLGFEGGGVLQEPDVIFSILGNGSLAMPASTTKTTLSITAASGLFKGSFTLTKSNPHTKTGIPQNLTRTVNYEGLIVPDRSNPDSPKKRGFGSGFFVIPQMPSSVAETLSNTPIQGGRVKLEKVD